VTTADRQHLVSLFRGKNPEKIPVGATRTLRLGEDDVNRLLAVGLGFSGEDRAARVELSPDHARAAASVALPIHAVDARFLNVTAAGRISVDGGAAHLDLSELSIGALSPPRWLLGLASPLTLSRGLATRGGDPKVRAVRIEAGRRERAVRPARGV
jgi:hypothetical protein